MEHRRARFSRTHGPGDGAGYRSKQAKPRGGHLAVLTAMALLASLVGGAGVASASGEAPYGGYNAVYGVDTDPVVIDVLANASDPEGDTLSVVPSSGTTDQGGTFECDSAQCTYTASDPLPPQDYDSFTYEVSDGTSTGTGTVAISFISHMPVPGYSTAYLSGPGPVVLDVLADASHPQGLPMTVVPSTSTTASGGDVSCDLSTCTYTPPDPLPDYDSFNYEITDGVYTVSGYVSVNSALPKANDDTAAYIGGASLVIDVLANDYSPLGNPLTAVVQSGTPTTGGGTVDCVTDGCTYFPPDPMPDTDTFTYQVTDGTLTSQPATVTVNNGVCSDPTGSLDDTGIVTGYEWLACTGPTSNEPVTDFTPLLPSTGASSFMMTSGTVEAAEPPNDSSGTTGSPLAPNTYRGANDVQVLRVDLEVPEGKTCLAFDFTFGSEEYPEYVGSFNDAFLAELDAHTWATVGNDIDAPGNFAFDSGGDMVSVNSTFFDPERVVTETGTEYDGSTPRLRAQTPVTTGAHSLYLSVFDAGDHVLDSGAIIDNLRVDVASEDGCQAGASLEIAIDDEVTTPEDTAVDIDVIANDLFAVTATPSVLLATQPANGTASCTAAGVCTYTPDPDFNGTDSFTYLVDDGIGGSDNGTVHVTVTPVNDDPVANTDSIDTDEGVPGSTNVLANDSDVDGDTLSISGNTQGANGSVTCAGATCTYTPAQGFSGTDSFTYTVNDGHGGTDTATVTVTVNPAGNTAPVATDDALVANEDASGSVDVLANDSDVDGDTLTISAFTQGTNGTVNCAGATCTYTPAGNFNGTDSFTYTVSDGNGGSDTATVSVTVNSVNDAPVATDDVLITDEDTDGTLSVVGNDTDVDGDTLSVTGFTQGTNGTVNCAGATCTYTPAANFNGTDSFTYTINDGNGGTDTATVSVTVNPVNDSPVVSDDVLVTDQDTAGSTDVLANDSDPEGDALSVTESSQGANGSVECTAEGVCTYTPAAGFVGSDSFTYTAHDGNGGIAVATVSVTVNEVGTTNTDPDAVDDELTTDEGVAASTDVLANDSDSDGDELSVSGNTQGANGSVTCTEAGVCTYTPDGGFSGSDSFTYTVSDGNGGTDTATVYVTVEPVVIGCGLDELDIALSGAFSGSHSGCINSGDLTVTRDSWGIRSVKGTARVPSISGGPGESVVSFDLNRFWILPAFTGKVRVVDADSGLNVTATALFSRLDGSGPTASGKLGGFTGKWWAPQFFTVNFKVDDLA